MYYYGGYCYIFYRIFCMYSNILMLFGELNTYQKLIYLNTRKSMNLYAQSRRPGDVFDAHKHNVQSTHNTI